MWLQTIACVSSPSVVVQLSHASTTVHATSRRTGLDGLLRRPGVGVGLASASASAWRRRLRGVGVCVASASAWRRRLRGVGVSVASASASVCGVAVAGEEGGGGVGVGVGVGGRRAPNHSATATRGATERRYTSHAKVCYNVCPCVVHCLVCHAPLLERGTRAHSTTAHVAHTHAQHAYAQHATHALTYCTVHPLPHLCCRAVP